MSSVIGEVLLGEPRRPAAASSSFWIEEADDTRTLAAYHRIRHDEFVRKQGLFRLR